jgi:hypothetical protein
MLTLWVHVHVHLAVTGQHLLDRVRARGGEESGQSTAEYALVLLGAASIALLVVLWAKNTGRVGKLLDAVIGNVTDKVKSG